MSQLNNSNEAFNRVMPLVGAWSTVLRLSAWRRGSSTNPVIFPVWPSTPRRHQCPRLPSYEKALGQSEDAHPECQPMGGKETWSNCGQEPVGVSGEVGAPANERPGLATHPLRRKGR